MNLNITLPEVNKEKLNIANLSKAMNEFCRKCGNYTDILTVDEYGTIRVSSFSNETMIAPVVMLFLLCKEYPQVFSFQVTQPSSAMPKFIVKSVVSKDNRYGIEYDTKGGVSYFSVIASDENDALIKANEDFKKRKELPQLGFWVKNGQGERAIQILNESSLKID